MAKSRIEAIEQKAILDIEISSVDAQTRLAMAGLTLRSYGCNHKGVLTDAAGELEVQMFLEL